MSTKDDDVMAHVDGPAHVEQQATASAVLPTATSGHSPLPWKVRNGFPAGRWFVDADFANEGIPGAHVVAECKDGPTSRRQANAALIVTAVNAHADLLAALKAAKDWLDELGCQCEPGDPDVPCALCLTRSAIQLAEAK